jgi:hypothetical protein
MLRGRRLVLLVNGGKGPFGLRRYCVTDEDQGPGPVAEGHSAPPPPEPRTRRGHRRGELPPVIRGGAGLTWPPASTTSHDWATASPGRAILYLNIRFAWTSHIM